MSLPFLKFTKIYYICFVLLVLASVFCILFFGLNFGVDFTGGSIVRVEFDSRPANDLIQEKLSNLDLGEMTIQPAGEKDVILRIKEVKEETHQKIISQLGELSPLKELSFENIGPAIGRELRQKTIMLVVVSLAALLLYISISFRKVSRPISSWQYGIVSIITLAFDVLTVIGLFAIFGKFYNVQFNIPIITALLTILGYTINDKVIIFDRIRENLLRRASGNFKELVNKSLNETIIRSLGTGTCSLIVLAFVFFMGGETLRYFSLALIIGIVVGTCSSLFLAAPLLVTWNALRQRK